MPDSAWASPVCLVKKEDGSYHFCTDYRKLNSVSHKHTHPLPDIREALDSLKGAKHYIVLDLLSGYWQIPNTDRAFCCRRGLFEFTRMSFGLSGAPTTFSCAMHKILKNELWKICLCYLIFIIIIIIIFSSTELELLNRFHTVLDRLCKAGLKLKPSKCTLFQNKIQYLGHLVTANGIKPLPDILEAIRNFPVPKYLGFLLQDFAKIAEPLFSLTKNRTPNFNGHLKHK